MFLPQVILLHQRTCIVRLSCFYLLTLFVGSGSFKFMTVRGAGHMVPTDNPAAGLEVLSKLIDITDNGSGYVNDDVTSNSNSSDDDRYCIS